MQFDLSDADNKRIAADASNAAYMATVAHMTANGIVIVLLILLNQAVFSVPSIFGEKDLSGTSAVFLVLNLGFFLVWAACGIEVALYSKVVDRRRIGVLNRTLLTTELGHALVHAANEVRRLVLPGMPDLAERPTTTNVNQPSSTGNASDSSRNDCSTASGSTSTWDQGGGLNDSNYHAWV